MLEGHGPAGPADTGIPVQPLCQRPPAWCVIELSALMRLNFSNVRGSARVVANGVAVAVNVPRSNAIHDAFLAVNRYYFIFQSFSSAKIVCIEIALKAGVAGHKRRKPLPRSFAGRAKPLLCRGFAVFAGSKSAGSLPVLLGGKNPPVALERSLQG